jgi:hypothetical protein
VVQEFGLDGRWRLGARSPTGTPLPPAVIPRRASLGDDARRMRIETLGLTRAPVIVIDDFMPDAPTLVDHAATHNAFSYASKFYPGMRMQAPRRYVERVLELLREPIARVFGNPAEVRPLECSFSLVTRKPEELLPFQRLPHFDGTDSNEIAVLHYLSQPHQGGTSFYRHRATQVEVVTPANVKRYVDAVNGEVAAQGLPPARYVSDGEPLFERIASFDAAFNRVLVYAGTSLHSGSIPPDFVPDADPRTGRLTLNTFLRLRR